MALFYSKQYIMELRETIISKPTLLLPLPPKPNVFNKERTIIDENQKTRNSMNCVLLTSFDIDSCGD
jgi:hypothetical protein